MGEIIEKKAVIIGSAPCQDWNFLRFYTGPDDFVIAADGGRNNALQAGLIPGWYVGDGDSGGCPDGLPSVVLPTEKDFTDLEVAVHQALGMGYRKLVLCGCTGGRMDHYLSNCFLLEQIHESGAEGIIVDDVNEIRYLYPGHFIVENRPKFCYIGIIPLDRTMEGVTLRGVKYEVADVQLRRSATLAVSNEIKPDHQAEIIIEKGCGLLVRSQRK